MDRVAVPSLGVKLSLPLPVIALVGRYPTNKLIGRRPIMERFLAKSLLIADYLPQEIALNSKIKYQNVK